MAAVKDTATADGRNGPRAVLVARLRRSLDSRFRCPRRPGRGVAPAQEWASVPATASMQRASACHSRRRERAARSPAAVMT